MESQTEQQELYFSLWDSQTENKPSQAIDTELISQDLTELSQDIGFCKRIKNLSIIDCSNLELSSHQRFKAIGYLSPSEKKIIQAIKHKQ